MQLDPTDAAAQSGLKVNDVILAVCGTAVEDHAHAVALFKKNANGLLNVIIVPASVEEWSTSLPLFSSQSRHRTLCRCPRCNWWSLSYWSHPWRSSHAPATATLFFVLLQAVVMGENRRRRPAVLHSSIELLLWTRHWR